MLTCTVISEDAFVLYAHRPSKFEKLNITRCSDCVVNLDYFNGLRHWENKLYHNVWLRIGLWLVKGLNKKIEELTCDRNLNTFQLLELLSAWTNQEQLKLHQKLKLRFAFLVLLKTLVYRPFRVFATGQLRCCGGAHCLGSFCFACILGFDFWMAWKSWNNKFVSKALITFSLGMLSRLETINKT